MLRRSRTRDRTSTRIRTETTEATMRNTGTWVIKPMHRLTFLLTRAETAAMQQAIKETFQSLQTLATRDSNSVARTGTRIRGTRVLPRGTPTISLETATPPLLRGPDCPEPTQSNRSGTNRGQAKTRAASTMVPSHSLCRISLLPSKHRSRTFSSSSTTVPYRRSRRQPTRSLRTSTSTWSSSKCSTSAPRKSRRV